MKPEIRSKTMWFFGALFALVTGLSQMPDVLALLPPDWAKYLLVFVAVMGMFLRTITTGPLGTPPAPLPPPYTVNGAGSTTGGGGLPPSVPGGDQS